MILPPRKNFKKVSGPSFNKKGKVIFRTKTPNALSIPDFRKKVEEHLNVKKWSDFCGSIVPEFDHRGNLKKESLVKIVSFLKETVESNHLTEKKKKRLENFTSVIKPYIN
jgi:hypothetical protein